MSLKSRIEKLKCERMAFDSLCIGPNPDLYYKKIIEELSPEEGEQAVLQLELLDKDFEAVVILEKEKKAKKDSVKADIDALDEESVDSMTLTQLKPLIKKLLILIKK